MVSTVYNCIIKMKTYFADQLDADANVLEFLTDPTTHDPVTFPMTFVGGSGYYYKIDYFNPDHHDQVHVWAKAPDSSTSGSSQYDWISHGYTLEDLKESVLANESLEGIKINESFSGSVSLSGMAADLFEAMQSNQVMDSVNEVFLTKPNADVSSIYEVINSTTGSLNADGKKIIESVATVATDGKISQQSWLSIAKSIFQPASDATEDGSLLLDDTKPFFVQSIVGMVCEILSAVLQTVAALLFLVLHGILSIILLALSALVSVISNFLQSSQFEEMSIDADATSGYVNGPLSAVAAYTSDVVLPFRKNDTHIYVSSHGPIDLYFWNQPGVRPDGTEVTNEGMQYVNTFISPEFNLMCTFQRLDSNIDWQNKAYPWNTGETTTSLPSVKLINNTSNMPGLPLPNTNDPDDIWNVPIDEAARMKIRCSKSVSAKMLRLAFMAACYTSFYTTDKTHYGSSHGYFPYVKAHYSQQNVAMWTIRDDQDVISWLNGRYRSELSGHGYEQLIANDDWYSDFMFGFQVMNYCTRNHKWDLLTVDNLNESDGSYIASRMAAAWQKYVIPYQTSVNYAVSSRPAALRLPNQVRGAGDSYGWNPNWNDSGANPPIWLTTVNYVLWSAKQASTEQVARYSSGCMALDVIPSDRTYTLPTVAYGSIAKAIAVACAIVVAASVTAFIVGRKIKRSRIKRQTKAQMQLDSLRDKYYKTGSAEDQEAYLKGVRHYNLKARFLGWSQYDASNGWVTDQGVTSPLNTITIAQVYRSITGERRLF